MERTPTRYALWSMLIITPALLILPVVSGALADMPKQHGVAVNLLAAVVTAYSLVVTALVAPGIVRSDASGLPRWAAALMAAGVLEGLVVLFAYGGEQPTSDLAGAYIPAALVVANLLALILLHAWVASEGMGFSPAVGLLTGSAYSAWVFRLGSSQELDAFVGASLIGICGTLIAACVVVFRDRTSSAPAPSDTP